MTWPVVLCSIGHLLPSCSGRRRRASNNRNTVQSADHLTLENCCVILPAAAAAVPFRSGRLMGPETGTSQRDKYPISPLPALNRRQIILIIFCRMVKCYARGPPTYHHHRALFCVQFSSEYITQLSVNVSPRAREMCNKRKMIFIIITRLRSFWAA